MNTKELQHEILQEIKELAQEISQVQNFAGLLMHQQKIQMLYEKFNFIKQLNNTKYLQIINEDMIVEGSPDMGFVESVVNEEKLEEIELKEDHKVVVTEEVPVVINMEPEINPEIEEEIQIVEEEVLPKVEIEDNIILQNTEAPVTIEEIIVEEEVKEEKTEPVQEIENSNKEKFGYKPLQVDYFDRIAFTTHLFNGDENAMNKEIEEINQTNNISEAKKWVERMFIKYNWQDKQEYVEILSKLIVNRFLEKNQTKEEQPIESKKEIIAEIKPIIQESKVKIEKPVEQPVIENIQVSEKPVEQVLSEPDLDFLVKGFPQDSEVKEAQKLSLSLTDSIDFISQLFNGSKVNMDKEIAVLNSLQTVKENEEWLKNMYKKYTWEGKEKIVKNLSQNIIKRFEFKDPEKLSPISVDIAEIKVKEETKEFSNPIKLNLNDSIAFISQLFNGSKTVMDKEFVKLNSMQTLKESLDHLIQMEEVYKWEEKEEYTERLKELISQRFSTDNE